MKILVVGATGYIGSRLVESIARENKVSATTRSMSLPDNKTNINYHYANLSDVSFTQNLPKDIDGIIYLAQSKHYRDFPTQAQDIYDVNVTALFNLLEWARKLTHLQHFMYTSTANVYKQMSSVIDENSELEPSSFYASSKLMGEMLVKSYSKYFSCTILRLFTVYGPQQSNTLIASLINKIINQHTIQIYGKQGLSLSPIFIEDLCHMINLVVKISPKTQFNIFNLASCEAFSILDITELLSQLCEREAIIEHLPYDGNSGWVANNRKWIDNYQYNVFTSFSDGLQKMLEPYLSEMRV